MYFPRARPRVSSVTSSSDDDARMDDATARDNRDASKSLDDDARATCGARVHREGALLCAFEGSRARVSSLARDGTSVTVGEMDAGARVADAAWRERAPTRDEREEDWHRTRAWCRSEERARVCASEETIGTSLAMVTEGGEVLTCRVERARERDGETRRGRCEIERVVRLEDGERATCVASDDEEMVIGTDRGRVVFVSWERGEEGRSATARKSARDGGATSVAWCPDAGTVVMRFESGAVGVVTIDGNGAMTRRNWFDAFPCPATCAAFHRGSKRLALGTADGETRVYEDATTSDASTPSVVCGLGAWGFDAQETGSVSHASWSNDGRALAVAWRRRGLSVWSESGCLLMCSVHHRGAPAVTPAASLREETDEETPNVGTCLCAPAWGIGGFSLFVVVLASSGKKLFEHSLAKSVPKIHVAPRVSANAPGEEPSLLIGDDRVFVVASNAAGKVRLRQEVVPGEYLRRQWPMRLASMNPEGSHIAIAGARGCVLYDTHRERWGMFRNFEEENAFEAIAFGWFSLAAEGTGGAPRSVLAVVAKHGEARMFSKTMKMCYSVRLYDDGGSGDVLTSMPLQFEPTRASVCGNFLVVAFATGEIAAFEVDERGSDVSMHAVREINGERRKTTLRSSSRIIGVCAVAPIDVETDSRAPTECVVLTEAGEVVVVDLTGRRDDVGVFTKVSEFWVSERSALEPQLADGESSGFDSDVGASDALPTDGGCIFAYGAEGVRVCYFPRGSLRRVLIEGARACDIERASSNPELEFDRELYPIAVSMKLNRIVGITQKLSFGDSADSPYYVVAPKVHTIVPYILRKLLRAGREDTALRYARAARARTPHFTHALEWLLFTSLEASSSRQVDSQDVLKKSIALLSELPNYLDIVVSVARKTDNTRWEALFKHAGKPSVLCHRALESKRVRIAACYILVVDKLEGEDVGRATAKEVMQAALEAREYELVEDLIKFLLKPIGARERREIERKPGIFGRVLDVIAPPPQSVLSLGERADRELTLDASEQELLKTHFDALARERDVVDMGAFVAHTSFDGAAYMRHETDEQGEAYISDFSQALLDAALCLRETKSRRGPSFHSPQSKSLFAVESSREPGGRSDESYAATLLAAAREAECTDWTLLLATVLGRADVLCDVFETQPELREPWVRVSKECVKRSSDGDLVARLTAIVADIERIASVAA